MHAAAAVDPPAHQKPGGHNNNAPPTHTEPTEALHGFGYDDPLAQNIPAGHKTGLHTFPGAQK